MPRWGNWKDSWRGDFWGGLNAGIVAIPLAMAFGVESGLGASAGLVGAVVLTFISRWVGGTPYLVSGPTGPMTLVAAILIANEMERSSTPEMALTTIFVIFLLSGLMQLFFGLLRLGDYVRYIPYSLVSGFMGGIGLLLILFQFFPLLGHEPQLHIREAASVMGGVIGNINYEALALAVFTILLIYAVQWLNPHVPGTLLALILGSLVAYAWHLEVPMLGDIPNEWTSWRWEHLVSFQSTQWQDVLTPALTLALLGSVDTLLTALAISMLANKKPESNKDLIGQGLGNIVSALAGGLPGTGATMRSIILFRAGAKSRWAVLVYCLILLVVLLEVSNLVDYVPLPVMAGILITVGLSIIDFKSLRNIRRLPRHDAIVMVVVMLVTVFFGLLQAFAAGIILASLFFVKKMADQNVKSDALTLIPENENKISDLNRIYLSREVHIQELSGPLFFGFSAHFREALEALPYTRAVIFRMEHVPFIDQSGVFVLKEVVRELRQKGIILLFAGLQETPREQLEKMEIIPLVIHPEWIFTSFGQAADWLENYLKQNPSQKLVKTNLKRDLDIHRLRDRMN